MWGSFREVRTNGKDGYDIRNAKNSVHLRKVWKCCTETRLAKDQYKKSETQGSQTY